MNVMFLRPAAARGHRARLGFARARTLQDLLGQADVIDIHTPLNDQTRKMINAKTVAAIKPGRVPHQHGARSDLRYRRHCWKGLRSGRLLAVGLDVLPKEPGQAEDPLVAAWKANEPWIRGRVLLNPHAAFFSPDAYVDQRTKGVQTAYFYLRDGALVNCVNAEYLKKPR